MNYYKQRGIFVRRILIVEDDRLLGQTLAFNLISDGYAVTLAGNRAEALGQWRPDTFELLILDVNLPDGNGFDLCATLRERGETCYILFLTANDRESDMMRGYEMGGSDYLTKPFLWQCSGARLLLFLMRWRTGNHATKNMTTAI